MARINQKRARDTALECGRLKKQIAELQAEVKDMRYGLNNSAARYNQLWNENKAQQEEIERLKNVNANISFDLNYFKAIFDGSWPTSIEILERTLAKAKALKESNGKEIEPVKGNGKDVKEVNQG